MKLTLPWLKEHLATEASLEEIVARLTMLGLEVEGVESRGADLAPFTVAEVTAVRRHPDAERLNLCEVDTGSARVEVVCGAPNVHAGMKAVFAACGMSGWSSVRAIRMANCAPRAPEMNHLCPFTTQWSPSSVARVWISVGSDPATSGSVIAKHERMRPSQSGRR